MTIRSRILKLNPAILVLASFLVVIITGVLLLKLPASTAGGSISWIDALFTATSAVCVTGLVVVDTGSYFSVLGQCVILGLIQIGGLGLMTISVMFFQWMGRSISIRQRMAMQDLFAHTPRADIIGLIKSIAMFTALAEITGGILLAIHWSRELSIFNALYTAFFHSVSAFCNAGFALYPDSMMRYSDDLLLNATLCGLIVIGGIGFPVLYDLQCWVKIRKQRRCRLSIQTKSVLLTTAVLIVVGTLMFGFLERIPAEPGQSLWKWVLSSVFQSITCRTAGFNTIDIASLKDATLAMMIFLMFVGASPGSCGGGVKTTTLTILSAFAVSRLRGQRRVNLFKKSIPEETVTRSVALVLIASGIICLVLFLILVGNATLCHSSGQVQGDFLKYLFETVSAFGTVGLSMGVTPTLNSWSKTWIVITMLIGRIGVLTFSYVIAGMGVTNGVEHSEENMMVG